MMPRNGWPILRAAHKQQIAKRPPPVKNSGFGSETARGGSTEAVATPLVTLPNWFTLKVIEKSVGSNVAGRSVDEKTDVFWPERRNCTPAPRGENVRSESERASPKTGSSLYTTTPKLMSPQTAPTRQKATS